MAAETVQERGRKFVKKVRYFFDSNYGFNVVADAYDGDPSVHLVENSERVLFDIQMYQKRRQLTGDGQNEDYNVHFYGECKWRNPRGSLKKLFQDFLRKALKTAPTLRHYYTDNYSFIFITNKKFQIDLSRITDQAYLTDYLGEDENMGNLHLIVGKLGVMIISDWFSNTLREGVRRW